MKWTKISAIIGTVLIVVSLILKLAGYESEPTPETVTICDYCPHIGWFGEPNSCESARKARLQEPTSETIAEPNEPARH